MHILLVVMVFIVIGMVVLHKHDQEEKEHIKKIVDELTNPSAPPDNNVRKAFGRIVPGGKYGSSRVELTDKHGNVTYHDG